MLFGKVNIAKNKLDNFEFTDGHNVCPSVNHLFTYMNKEKKIPGHILSLFIILLSISGVCLLMYKAQFRFNLHQPIEYVMMTTHKPTGTITYHNLVLGFPHSYRDVYLYSS